MARKHRHTRVVTEIIETSDVIFRGELIVVFQSRVAPDHLEIITKEIPPKRLAHTMPDGLIFLHKAESDKNTRRPYRRLQDDILFWQNFDLAHVTEFLGRTHLTTKETFASLAEEIYNAVNSVRSERADRAKS